MTNPSEERSALRRQQESAARLERATAQAREYKKNAGQHLAELFEALKQARESLHTVRTTKVLPHDAIKHLDSIRMDLRKSEELVKAAHEVYGEWLQVCYPAGTIGGDPEAHKLAPARLIRPRGAKEPFERKGKYGHK